MAEPNRATRRAVKKAAPKIKREADKVRQQREADLQGIEDLEVTDISEWKKAAEGTKLQLPSGNVCLARNVGLAPFIEEGMIPNSLLPLVLGALEEGKGKPKKDTALDIGKLLKEQPDALVQMLHMSDVIVCHAVIKPPIEMPPENKADRRDDVLYADEVDPEDKQFITQWVVGGTRDLERFRAEQAAALADVSAGAAMERET